VLILHRGRVLRLGRLDEMRREAAANGRHETLEEMFFRLTETPSSQPIQVPPVPADAFMPPPDAFMPPPDDPNRVSERLP
jgi:hypothetical protein